MIMSNVFSRKSSGQCIGDTCDCENWNITPFAFYPLCENAEDCNNTTQPTIEVGTTYSGCEGVSFSGNDSGIGFGRVAAMKTQQVFMSTWVEIVSLSNQMLINNHIRASGDGGVWNGGCGISLYFDKITVDYFVYNNETFTDSEGHTTTSYAISASYDKVIEISEKMMISAIVNDNNAKLYLDGVLVCTVTSSQSMRFGTHEDNLSIANIDNSPGAIYSESVQKQRNVVIDNTLWSDADVIELYNSQKTDMGV